MLKNILLIILFLQGICAVASDTLYIKEEQEYDITGSYLDILEDPGNNLPFTIVSSPESDKKFSVLKKIYPYRINENINSAYWIRIRIDGSGASYDHYLFQFYNPTISQVEMYYYDHRNQVVHQKAGALLPFSVRQYKYRTLLFGAPVYNGVQTIYFRVKSDSYSGFSFNVGSFQNFYTYARTEYYVLGIFIGVILIMVVYNFLTYLSIRENIYLIYCLFAVSAAMFALNYTWHGFEFLWPEFPAFNHYASTVSSSMFLWSIALYTVRTMNLKRIYPRLTRWLMGLVYGVILYGFLSHYALPAERISEIIYLLPFLMIFFLAIGILRRGNRVTQLFFTGFSCILISLVISLVERSGFFNANFFSIYSFNFAVIAEVIIFSYTLTVRLGMIKQERERAMEEKNRVQMLMIRQHEENETLKDKVNRELEEKVKQRTEELKEKNIELSFLYEKVKSQAEELSKWTVKLDLDNKKLSDDIKNVIESRVLFRNVEFDEFNRIFPDDQSCFRFLETLKWTNGFKCLQCGHDHYCGGKALFARKCTKCRFEESPLYNTIFQHSKIPLNKQFYMLFMIYSSNGEISSTELAGILSMRLKTCWAFNKKVRERMKGRKWEQMDGWDSLILLPE